MRYGSLLILIILLAATGCTGGTDDANPAGNAAVAVGDRDVLFQTTPYSGMLDGLFDGAMTVGELRRHGDIGVGTFNALDGELIGLDGEFWQVRSDGSVHRAGDDMMTPFAVVTMFEPDVTVRIDRSTDFDGLIALVDSLRPTENIFYAIRVRGEFASLKTKSVPKQTKPYPPLADVLLDQPMFDILEVSGTIVGFWQPPFIEGVNVPGYHFHFLTDARDSGGHVMECVITRAVVEIDYTAGFHMALVRTPEYDRADLTRNMQEELARTGQYEYLDDGE